MALTRRRFVRAAGIGAAGALTSSWIGARGREHRVWSAFEPTLQAVEPGQIVLASNENPLGPGRTVMSAVQAAFGEGGRRPGRYSGRRRGTTTGVGGSSCPDSTGSTGPYPRASPSVKNRR